MSQLNQLFSSLHTAGHNVKNRFASKKDESKLLARSKLLDHGPDMFVDLSIRFIGASGLPKMDVVGSADPFFMANIDDEIKFVSSVKANTQAPVWNEKWRVKNVPKHAILEVQVMDKDEGTPLNDFIGKFKVDVNPGAKEVELIGPMLKLRSERGHFWLEIESKPASDSDPHSLAYDFDGPIRYSRHTSPTAGKLTNLNEARLYATWKMYLKGVKRHFGDVSQHWNRDYKSAQTIFKGPSSIAVRQGIKAAHDILYSRTTENGYGIIEGKADILSILHGGGASRPNQHQSEHQVALSHRVKPAIYTYAISMDDNSLRFSETGAAFFVDFASKHALHAKCATSVWYSGEFHPRPKGGWENFSDDKRDEDVDWELLIDNNSGTYAPDKAMLPTLQKMLEYNFPGFNILALDREDEELKKSVAACREYALKKRDVPEDELQPTLSPGEESLCHRIWDFRKPGSDANQKPPSDDDSNEADERDPGNGLGDLNHQEGKK
ncbi:hypothetical protein M408DRAFT_327138 [Serendipita vermifera MAFF 305830]|uniref:C2 domain-containing protein n=1 Tax=Serendipita vermifera MAFF 305830 TaxID=933852 RepID=A0A0C3B4B7_SERVB|nr:hypothetical protein M408DRAFT_327138 [Serendipita vermifera MAFF 305830]